MRTPAPIAVTLAAVALVACVPASNPPPLHYGPGIHLLGAAQPDTIGAPSSQLQLIANDGVGNALAGARVTLTPQNMFIFVDNPIEYGYVSDPIVMTTDFDGRIFFKVQFGNRTPAGTIVVAVTDSTTGVTATDTLPFAILPGHPLPGHAVVPADTSLYPGRGFTIRAGSRDRLGNLVPLAATFTAASGLSVAADGTVTAVDYGRNVVVATTSAGTDTSWVSVVPQGTLLAYQYSSDTWTMNIVALDGSSRGLAPWTQLAYNNEGFWTPDGQHFLVSAGYNPAMEIVDLQGNYHRFGPDSMPGISNPAFSADGSTVFFLYYTDGSAALWRANADGSNASKALPFDVNSGVPSPDGRLAAADSSSVVRVFSVADGTPRPWRVAGADNPQWSPDGKSIAMSNVVTGAGMIVDAVTGQLLRSVGAGGLITWSPDSQWLLVTSQGRTSVIRASDGLTVPLPAWSLPYTFTSWNPKG